MKIHPELDLGPSVRFSTVIPSSNENRGLLELKDDSLTFQIQQSVQLSSTELLSCAKLTLCNPMTAACQASLSITTPGACPNSCALSWWCHPTISSSVVPFSSCLQSFLASGSSPMSQFFASGGQSIGVSASVLPMNIQDWFPLGWTGWISLLSKGLKSLLQHHS